MLIVTVGRARGALTAVRELGRAGWTVGVGTPNGAGMVAASRWCEHRHVVPRPRGDGEAFVGAVGRAVESVGYDLVVGGSDDFVAALAAHAEAIPCLVGHPSSEVIDRAFDKLEVAGVAAGLGFDVPRAVVATDEETEAWNGPVVVKCRSHWSPGQRNVVRIESRRFAGAAEATDRIRLIRDAGFEPILQEPVDGRLEALAGIFRDGRLEGRVQQVADGLWPTPSGPSSRATTVPIDEALAEQCERLLSALGWHGLVELQFLTDPAGRRSLIDLNGRCYGSIALAVAAGVNLPVAAARHSLGEPFATLDDARPGVRFSWIAGDMRRAMIERRGGLVRDLAASTWWALRSTNCVWDRRDLGPVRGLVAGRLGGSAGGSDSDVDG